jgi:hypothetical protein
MKTIDLHFYPGWTRKSMTFTIDDGNVKLDRKFLDITEPAGLKGTFNLKTPLTHLTPEEYREFYKGYEISNHCKYHAYAFTPHTTREIKNEIFDRATADKAYGYLTEEEGLYRIFTYGWTYLATDEKYMECVDDCQRELEALFGKGKIRGYVWPCGLQQNERVIELMRQHGFQAMRRTGYVADSTGFALPEDRLNWSYNADYQNMLELGEKYDAYPDDGELKFFCFGVHSHDFENAGRWDVLVDFCNRYGNRPNDFWYASVGEILDYEDAVNAVEITDNEIRNPSDIDLYIKVDGERKMLSANSYMTI